MTTDFVMREITEQNESYPDIEVVRTRTSNGHCGITIKLDDQQITITNEKAVNQGYGDEYERVADELAKTIHKLVGNPCLLPEEKKS